jgi:peptidoglycan/xylan/chitin deacetylase (PgdA/CDA1 family)
MIAGDVLSAATLATAGCAVHGMYWHNSFVFGSALGRLPTRERIVSLTFDDGPNPDATPRILDALAEADVKATFFILGKHAEQWPRIVERAANDGHQIGNHGWHHRKLHVRGPRYVRNDLVAGTRAIEQACGVEPRHFRAPHGFRSPWVTPIARALGQRTIGWTLGVWDSARPGADEIARRTVVGARPGSILLLHDGDGYDENGDRSQTADALPAIISGLRDRGYRFDVLPN